MKSVGTDLQQTSFNLLYCIARRLASITRIISQTLFVSLVSLPLALSENLQSTTDSPRKIRQPVGALIGAHTLRNLPLRTGVRVAYQFEVPRSGYLKAVRPYWIFKSKPGYHQGNGGIIELTVKKIEPNRIELLEQVPPLAREVFYPNLSASKLPGNQHKFRAVSFKKPPLLKRGDTVAVLFRNVASNAEQNWISVNVLSNLIAPPKAPCAFHGHQIGSLKTLIFHEAKGRWRVSPKDLPVVELDLEDLEGKTTKLGNGYMELWNYNQMFRISGNRDLAQSMHLKRERSFSRFAIFGTHLHGPSPLKAELFDLETKRTLFSTKIPVSKFRLASCPTLKIDRVCDDWVAVDFKTHFELSPRTDYKLRLSTSKDSAYQVGLIRDGSRTAHHFSPSTTFSEGQALYPGQLFPFGPGVNRIGVPSKDGQVDLPFALCHR